MPSASTAPSSRPPQRARLHPSAVSQQIKRLERHTGVQLLERVGRGVALTELGCRLADDGNRVLGDLEAIEAQSRRPTGVLPARSGADRGLLHGVRGLVALALATLRHTDPGLDVRVVESDPHEALDLVAVGARSTPRSCTTVGRPAAADPRACRGRPPGDRHCGCAGPPRPSPGHSIGHHCRGPGRAMWTCAPVGSGSRLARPLHRRLWPAARRALLGDGVLLADRPGRELERRGPGAAVGLEALPSGVIAVPVDDPVTRRILQVSARRWRRARPSAGSTTSSPRRWTPWPSPTRADGRDSGSGTGAGTGARDQGGADARDRGGFGQRTGGEEVASAAAYIAWSATPASSRMLCIDNIGAPRSTVVTPPGRP